MTNPIEPRPQIKVEQTNSRIISLLNKPYRREEFIVGVKMVPLTPTQIRYEPKFDLKRLETICTLKRYIRTDKNDDPANDYVEIELEYEGKTLTHEIKLYEMILLKDRDLYIRKNEEQWVISDALNGVVLGNRMFMHSERVNQWLWVDVPFERKLALIGAGVDVENIHLYDELNIEELKTLKHHIRAMEGSK